MHQALNLTDVSSALKLTRRGGHERKKNDYQGGIQIIILPFDSKIKKQKSRLVRYLKDWIVMPDEEGNLQKISPCELTPVHKGGDVEFTYWSQRCRYKLPDGAQFLKRQDGRQ